MAAGGARAAHYSSRLTCRTVLICLVAGTGGILFGFDIGIAGGVASMDGFLQRFFPEVVAQKAYAQQQAGASTDYCQYDSQVLQLWQSSMFLAGAAAGLCAGWVSNRCGRKATMVLGGASFIAGAALQATASHVAMLVVGRVVLGVGIGFANQAVPLYLSEMAPYILRGALNMLFQMATAIGILIATCVNYGTNFMAADVGWRVSLGAAAAPAFAFFIGALLLPDSPNSLIQRGQDARGRQVLELVRGSKAVEAELADIRDAVAVSRAGSGWALFTQRRHFPQLLFAIFIPLAQQCTGINTFMFYAPQIFNTLGMSQAGSLLGTVTVSAVNIGATILSIILVDRVGRKKLFLSGGIQMFAAQIATTALMAVTVSKQASPPLYAVVLLEALICMFTSGFAYSWGPLGWLVPTEIHDIDTRSLGQSVTVFCNFLASFSIAQAYLSLMCRLQFATFLLFASCVACMTVAVAALLPETQGVPIEEVHLLWQRHRVWRRWLAAGAVSEGSCAAGSKSPSDDAPASPRPDAGKGLYDERVQY